MLWIIDLITETLRILISSLEFPMKLIMQNLSVAFWILLILEDMSGVCTRFLQIQLLNPPCCCSFLKFAPTAKVKLRSSIKQLDSTLTTVSSGFKRKYFKVIHMHKKIHSAHTYASRKFWSQQSGAYTMSLTTAGNNRAICFQGRPMQISPSTVYY